MATLQEIKIPKGFHVAEKQEGQTLPKGFRIEGQDSVDSLPKGFRFEDERQQFGFGDQDIASKLHPIERGLLEAGAQAADIAASSPAYAYAGARFSVNKMADIVDRIYKKDFSLPAKVSVTGPIAIGEEFSQPLEGEPLITQDVPEWLRFNKVRNQLQEYAESISYLNERYPNDTATSLFAEGRYGEMTDWLFHQTIVNAPYFIMTTALSLTGNIPAAMAFAAVYSGSAKFAELQESKEAEKYSTDEQFRIAFQTGLAEAGPQILGGKGVQYSAKLFKSIGVKAGGQVLESSLMKAFTTSLKAIGINIVTEGLEEGVTEAVQGEIDMYYQLEDGLTYAKIRDRMVNAMMIGAFSGGLISTPGAITKGILDSSKVNKDTKAQGLPLDLRMTRQEFVEIKATLEIQNQGYADPNTEETIITPGSLNADEVELAQVVDEKIETRDYKDPGEENLDYLGNAIGGLVEREIQKDIFEEDVREKIVAGIPLTPAQEEYQKYKTRQVEDIKNIPVEEIGELSDEDRMIWYQENMPEKFESDEAIASASALHDAFLAEDDLESAQNIRESIASDSAYANAIYEDMLEKEQKFVPAETQISKEEKVRDKQEARLEELYRQLEIAESAPMGQVGTEQYIKGVEKIILEIESLQEKLREPKKIRRTPPEGVKVEKPTKTKKRKPIPPKEEAPKLKLDKNFSTHYEKIKKEFGFDEAGVEYDKIELKDQDERAYDYIQRNPESAMRIAYGMEESKGDLNKDAIRRALVVVLKENRRMSEAEDIARRMSKSFTQAAQTLNIAKLNVSNLTEITHKITQARLERIADKLGVKPENAGTQVKTIIKKKAKSAASEVVTETKKTTVQEADDLIRSLIC